MRFDEFDQYSEDMLLAQYVVSEIISHELMKGEVREDFLLETLLSCSVPKPTIVKGTVSDGTSDAGQLDLILLRSHAHPRQLGGQCVVEKKDALCIIEVKGHCTGEDLRKANRKARLIAQLDGDERPLYGVISYRAKLEKKTLLNRFGFKYDKENQTYFDNALLRGESQDEWQRVEYPDLDFFMCFEEGKKMFLRKYVAAPDVERFLNNPDQPVIKNVFSMVRSLWENSCKSQSVSHV
jgi:hypothetical protein